MYMEQGRGNELRPAGHLCFCLSPYLTHYDFFFFFFNAYFIFEGKRANMSGGGAEREGDRECQADSTLSVQSPTWGSI